MKTIALNILAPDFRMTAFCANRAPRSTAGKIGQMRGADARPDALEFRHFPRTENPQDFPWFSPTRR
jgi:hypothetical protein